MISKPQDYKIVAEMRNDVSVDPVKFDPASIPPETHEFNRKLLEIGGSGPKWYQVGAPKYREMRAAGETPLPKAVYLDQAEQVTIPCRDAGRDIPCRILRPENGTTVTGVYLHIHGGGWVLQDEKSQDQYLQNHANSTGLICFSVGYRRAPEDPWPAGANDCYDAAEWLIDNAQEKFQTTLKFAGGESAGGHLSVLIAFYLLQHPDQKYSSFAFQGLILHFGCYDLTFTPSVYTFIRPPILVLDRDLMESYIKVLLPDMTLEQKRDPSVSPLYMDMNKLRGRLPPAIFTCGTEDPLLDDTVFMSAKWIAAGADTKVLIVPGGAHGFIAFPRSVKGAQSAIGLDAVDEFVQTHL